MNTKLIDSLVQIIQALSEEERSLLQQKLNPASIALQNANSLRDEAFIGMWRDRPEMEDSSQWVRNLRQQQWSR
ncbi:MAG: hypothetical protein HC895_23090 [Leptolyngbyaceae cyanobacterium SM1_3_5]|nr:hypothetical protein [Leptolyngbyaceae cyanobacterium SM1_3_5]